MKNLFKDVPDSLPEELVEVLLQNNSLRIERIVSTGHSSAEDFWYDQEEHEWILLLQGEAKLELKGEPDLISLNTGDSFLLPAHCLHRVAWTSIEQPTIWLAIFYQ